MYKKVRLIKLSNEYVMWCPENKALKIIDAIYNDENKTFKLGDNCFKAKDVVSVCTEDFIAEHFNEFNEEYKDKIKKAYDPYLKEMRNEIANKSVNELIKTFNKRQTNELLGATEENDDLLGIKIKRSNQTIEHRDYKDRNKYNLTNN